MPSLTMPCISHAGMHSWVAMFDESICCAAGARDEATVSAAHLFLQRVLYRINRMAFFWCALTLRIVAPFLLLLL